MRRAVKARVFTARLSGRSENRGLPNDLLIRSKNALFAHFESDLSAISIANCSDEVGAQNLLTKIRANTMIEGLLLHGEGGHR